VAVEKEGRRGYFLFVHGGLQFSAPIYLTFHCRMIRMMMESTEQTKYRWRNLGIYLKIYTVYTHRRFLTIWVRHRR
jgi:hypothetical protein